MGQVIMNLLQHIKDLSLIAPDATTCQKSALPPILMRFKTLDLD